MRSVNFKTCVRRGAMVLVAGYLLVIAPALGQSDENYEVSWYTIDGGGGMFSVGGDFELSGTIGQPDALTVVLSGGDFELAGGFWPVAAEPCAGFVCGDANCDGTFNAADIDAFFEALGDPAAWQAAHPGCDLLCVADTNYDGLLNGADIDPFFEALAAGNCP